MSYSGSPAVAPSGGNDADRAPLAAAELEAGQALPPRRRDVGPGRLAERQASAKASRRCSCVQRRSVLTMCRKSSTVPHVVIAISRQDATPQL